MKKFRLILVSIFSLVAVCVNSQSLTKDFTVNGTLQTGANYLPLLGIHGSKNMALYTDLMAFHKSGFGVAYFAYDDFSKEETGRIRFVDAAYTGSWNNFSLYSAFEYVWYDNWSDGESVMPYAILTYAPNSWSYEVAPMLTYFPHFSENKYEFTAYAKVTKTVLKDVDIHATVWYDNVYEDHFYGAVGLKVNLPSNFYIMGNLLYKEGDKFTPFINVGWKFSTSK